MNTREYKNSGEILTGDGKDDGNILSYFEKGRAVTNQ